MKRFVRILIPVLLALALIALSIWYLFIYDREFTQDVLLSCARFFEDNGKHDTAQWFYGKAYEQAEGNEEVAIELARQYLEMGNYTQAEYTLDTAIGDGGGVELYVELCNVYVKQDKLLDAIKLLNDAPEAIRAQLDPMRPSVPVPDPAPQDINMYISVSITSENGTVYAVTGNQTECPSVQTDLYTGPIPLQSGVNIIRAISVADNGLVSTLETFQYTVGGVVEEVTFADPAMEAALREAVGISQDTPVLTSDLWNVTAFSVPAEATDYSDLQHLTFLETLTVDGGASDQLTWLSGRSNLKTLIIRNTAVSQEALEIIGKLPLLQSLTMRNCGLSTCAPLASLTKLTYLDLDENSLRDISALSSMTNLQQLSMSQNSLVDLSALETCTALTALDVSYNSLTDISTVLSLPGMTSLIVSHNEQLSSVAGIENLVNLTQFYASNCRLTDVSALAGCAKLSDLDISYNALTDITALSKLNGLIVLNFAHNSVHTIPTWSTDCALVTIDGSYNRISTLEPLSGLKALNNILMERNTEISTVASLIHCPVLIKVNVDATRVSDADELRQTGVIVIYDPTQTMVDQTVSTDTAGDTGVTEDAAITEDTGG